MKISTKAKIFQTRKLLASYYTIYDLYYNNIIQFISLGMFYPAYPCIKYYGRACISLFVFFRCRRQWCFFTNTLTGNLMWPWIPIISVIIHWSINSFDWQLQHRAIVYTTSAKIFFWLTTFHHIVLLYYVVMIYFQQ